MKKKCLIIVLITYASANVFAQTDSIINDSVILPKLKILPDEPDAVTPPEMLTTETGNRSLSITNPRISVITDFQGGYHYFDKKNFSAGLSEVELSFQSAVDPYALANIYLSLEKDPATMKMEAGIEEAYLTTLALPFHLQLKAGRFKNTFGRANAIHSHAQPFIEAPMALENYLGEGLSGDGFSLSWLIPQSLFFQKLTVELTDGPVESSIFARGKFNEFLYSAHLKNFFSLSEDLTLELGFSAATGPNDSAQTTRLGAADLTLKWKPLQMNAYKSFTWQTEWIFAEIGAGKAGTLFSNGWYSMLSWQFARRWFITARVDYAAPPYSNAVIGRSLNAMFGWYATEFQKLELEGSVMDVTGLKKDYTAHLRWIFVIGSHGAHSY